MGEEERSAPPAAGVLCVGLITVAPRVPQTMPARFEDRKNGIAVRGWLREAARTNGDAVLLTHGAGADCNSKLLLAVAGAFEAAGFTVLRFDLPFRQERPHGPPSFGSAARDRDGIRRAIEAIKERARGRIFVGGHSYGGRQATMLIAEEPQLADGLLLLSYPLHPPRKPEQLRTAHFSKLRTPAFFAHGTRDPFGTIEEMKTALDLIGAPHRLFEVEGAGHDLLGKSATGELPGRIVGEFQAFIDRPALSS
jgi:uncharacterized protein